MGDYSWLSWKLRGATQAGIMASLQAPKREGEELVGLNEGLANRGSTRGQLKDKIAVGKSRLWGSRKDAAPGGRWK